MKEIISMQIEQKQKDAEVQCFELNPIVNNDLSSHGYDTTALTVSIQNIEFDSRGDGFLYITISDKPVDSNNESIVDYGLEFTSGGQYIVNDCSTRLLTTDVKKPRLIYIVNSVDGDDDDLDISVDGWRVPILNKGQQYLVIYSNTVFTATVELDGLVVPCRSLNET